MKERRRDQKRDFSTSHLLPFPELVSRIKTVIPKAIRDVPTCGDCGLPYYEGSNQCDCRRRK